MICGLNSCLIELLRRIFDFQFSFVLTFSTDLSISLGNINVTHCIKPFLLSIYQVLRESFTVTRRIKNKIISFWSQTGRWAEPNCPYVKASREFLIKFFKDIHFPTSLPLVGWRQSMQSRIKAFNEYSKRLLHKMKLAMNWNITFNKRSKPLKKNLESTSRYKTRESKVWVGRERS